MDKKKLSFEELFQEANKPHSDIIDGLTTEEQEDLELIVMTENLLTTQTELWLKTPTRKTAECLTEMKMLAYFEGSTPDPFKQSVKQHILHCPACFDKLTDYHQKLRAHPPWPVLARYYLNPEKVSTEDREHIKVCDHCQSGVKGLVITFEPKPETLQMAAYVGSDIISEFEFRLDEDVICSAKIWRRRTHEQGPDHLVLTLDFDPTRLELPKNLIGKKIQVNLRGIDSLKEWFKWNEAMYGKIDKKGIAQLNLGELRSKETTNQELKEKLSKINPEIHVIENESLQTE